MRQVAMKTIEYLAHDTQIPYRQAGKATIIENKPENFYDTFHMTGTLLNLDGKYVYWVGMDIGGVDLVMTDIFYEEICKVTDKLDKENFIFSGTHTHSGPNTSKDMNKFRYVSRNTMTEADIYADMVRGWAKEAAEIFAEDEKNLKEFDSYIAVVPIEGMYSNRNALDKPCDKNINLIKFTEKGTENIIGLWMQLTCHSTMIFPKNPKMSTDLVGNTRDKVAAYFNNVPVMPFVGCAGDTSTRLTRQRGTDPALDYSELQRLSTGVYEQIIAKMQFEPLTIDRYEVEHVELQYEYHYNKETIKKRMVRLQKQIDEETNPQQTRLLVQSMGTLKEKLEMEDTRAWDKLHGRAINMGGLKFGVFPGELVASLGAQIIKHEPDNHQLVLCYTYLSIGYLVEIAEYGNNFESISSNIPVGLPEVLTGMIAKKLEEF